MNGLSEIREDGGTLHLGAMVRHADVAAHPLIQRSYGLLADAARNIGDPQVRNRGTLAGSLVHADPSAELPLLAVALDATFHLRSAQASRSVAAKDFYQGYLLTDITPDELLVTADFYLPPAHCGWCCTEVARRQGDFAIVAVAVLLGCGRDRTIDFARVAIGGAGPAPLRVTAAEDTLVGERPDAQLFHRVGDVSAQAVEPPNDIHASSNYRRHLAGVLVRRALTTAESRISGRA